MVWPPVGCWLDRYELQDLASEELGPVDWIVVVEFPGSKFNGQMAAALPDLVERDLIRVLDLVVLKKDADGSLEAFELSELEEGEIGEPRCTSQSWRCCSAKRT